jgi:ferrous iron transport protein A
MLSQRLAGLGLTVGAMVEVLQNYGRGPLIVAVRDTRIALGRGQADKVLVEPRDG